MLKRFDDEPIMNFDDIEEQYPDTKYIVRIYNITDEEGALIAVSENNDSLHDLCVLCQDLQESAKDGALYGLFGSYNNGGAIGVQYEVKK